jgi:PAS domain S-box-containing protein
MAVDAADIQRELNAEVNRLVVRRTRVALWIGLMTVATFAASNHLRSAPPPWWSDVMNLVTAALIGLGFLALTIPAIKRRPVLIALVIFAFGSCIRSSAGIAHGEVATTAIVLVALALIGAATIPWGVIAQLITAGIAGVAIATNSYFVMGTLIGPGGQAATAVALALVVSVGLTIELERHRVRTLAEIRRRREAEADLARFNAELERRVHERTEQLEGTTQRLECEVQEHQRAIESVRESERRLQEVLDHAMAAIYLRDADGRYVLVNRYWEEMVQRPAADVVGRNVEEIMPPEAVDALQEHNRLVLESRQPMQFEETIRSPGGVRTWVSVKFPQFDAHGRAVGVWGISTDITERKRAEEQARQHQADLAHVLRLGTVGEMAAGLAHEINQPLGAVANYAQGAVLRMRNGSVRPAELLPVLEAMAHEALRAGEIVRRMRDLVRKEPSELKPADLNALVRDSVKVVEGDARQLGIEVQLDLASELPAVLCDGVQIEQVILNLLRNALEAVQEHSDGGGCVAITTAASGRDAVAVSVRDNGVGLPEPSVDVFAPFFSTKAHGLGMGLSISRSIIEAHHGQVSATRNDDGGSTFSFSLPLDGAGAPALSATRA